MNLITMAFGEDALPDGDGLLQAAEVLVQYQQAGHTLIAVVGALPGVADLLRESVELANYARVHNKLLSMHTSVARKLIHEPKDRALLIQDITDMLGTYQWLGRAMMNRSPTPAEAAAALAVGDRLSARLLAGHLQNRGVRAVHVAKAIATNADYLAATPDLDATVRRIQEKIVPLLDGGYIVVVDGGSGVSLDGKLTRLNGQGLYRTASLLAASSGAEGLWLMTDHDGILTADPKLVVTARTIPVLPASVLDDLAAHGFRVPTAVTISPAVAAHIPVFVRSVLNPTHPGTYIRPQVDPAPEFLPVIVTRRNIRALTVTGENLEPAAALQALAAEQIPALVGYSSPETMHFILRTDQVDIARLVLSSFFADARLESDVRCALVTLIGADGVNPVYLARQTDAPAQGISLIGSSTNMYPALLVDEEHLESATEKIHNWALFQ